MTGFHWGNKRFQIFETIVGGTLPRTVNCCVKMTGKSLRRLTQSRCSARAALAEADRLARLPQVPFEFGRFGPERVDPQLRCSYCTNSHRLENHT